MKTTDVSSRSPLFRGGTRALARPAVLLALALVAALQPLGGAGLEGEGSRESDLAAIRARADELEGQLAAIRERKRGLIGDLVEADYELQVQQQRLAEASESLRNARLDLEAAERSTADVELRLAAARAAASRRITGLYRTGGRGALPMILSVRFEGDLLSVLRSLRFLVRRDVELRRALNEARAEMTVQVRHLRFQRREVEILVDTEAARLEDSRRLRRRLSSLLGEVERRESATVREFGGLADRESKLIDLLDRLERAGGETLAGREIRDYRGALDRPIVGSIVRGFGPRRDPRYKTMVPHNGLQFAGLRDEAVRAVYPGRVVYAGTLEGYGETIIVLHPGRVFTLYAGLAAISVARDELVSIGQRIGTADSGLYFEVREENRPVDPAEWIR